MGEFGAARVLVKPAIDGTGVIAGGPVRPLFELAGIKNVLSKSIGSSNGLNIIKAAAEALKQLSSPRRPPSVAASPSPRCSSGRRTSDGRRPSPSSSSRAPCAVKTDQTPTCRAIGLRKISDSHVLPDNESVRGMIFKVKHLVTVEEN